MILYYAAIDSPEMLEITMTRGIFPFHGQNIVPLAETPEDAARVYAYMFDTSGPVYVFAIEVADVYPIVIDGLVTDRPLHGHTGNIFPSQIERQYLTRKARREEVSA